jgi:adenosylhomocysteine nucleosidase
MILIVGALKGELIPFINHFNIIQKNKLGLATLYAQKQVHVIRTGVGQESALSTLTSYFKSYNPTNIINVGTAGALNPDIPVGSIHHIKTFVDEKSRAKLSIAENISYMAYRQSTLLTVTIAVIDSKRAQELNKSFSADLVDMEAFFIAELSAKRNIPFSSFKIVSDRADKTAETEFVARYISLSEQLAKKIIPQIEMLIV